MLYVSLFWRHSRVSFRVVGIFERRMLYCAAVVSLISLTHELSVSEVWVMTGAVVSVYLCCLQLQNIHNSCSSRKKACKSFIIFRLLPDQFPNFFFKFLLFEKVYSSSLFDLFCACKCISLNNKSLLPTFLLPC